MKAVGARLPRYDGVGHVTGRTQFVDDVRVRGTLVGEGAPLAAPPRRDHDARHDARPRRMTGVHAVDHARGRPAERLRPPRGARRPRPTSRCSPTDEVRYKGQPIAVGRRRGRGDRAARPSRRSRSTFDEREPLFDIRKALDPDAPQIHQWGQRLSALRAVQRPPRSARATSTARSSRPTRSSQGVYRPQAIEQLPMETQVCARRCRRRAAG